MNIRPASLEDLSVVVRMGINFHSSSQYATLIDANLDAMAATAAVLINGADTDILLAAVSQAPIDGHVVGMLGLATYNHPISGARAASELFWWVEPEYRGATGLKLLRSAEHWARSHGAHILQMVAPSAEVEALYDRLGYTRVEVSYQKKVV